MHQYIQFLTRHWPLTLALVAVIVALIVNEMLAFIKGGSGVTTGEAVRLINREDALVVDIRDKNDFRKAHILNAKNIPGSQLENRVKELRGSKDKPVIVYCANGASSTAAGEKLRTQGFAKVVTLKGGLAAWQSASLPVVSK